MKILYGVQGTGNGHLTRARSMAKAFAHFDVEVDWVFSGRKREDFFDMDVFGDFRCYKGMTLHTKKGKVNMLKTVLQSDVLQLKRDIHSINADDYDLAVSDFEPVTAWAARKHKIPCVGVSHQCAFLYPIPKRANNLATDIFMRWFAPISIPVGVHWHHFDQPLLPPIVEPSEHINQATPGKILVYLPFADVEDFLPLLEPFTQKEFYIYHKFKQAEDRGNLHLRPFSREGFQQDLHSAEGVICSAGFELPSEAISLGKKLLVEPVRGQMEQQSNALALQALGYAASCQKLSRDHIEKWLPLNKPQPLNYPDVALEIARWMVEEKAQNLPALSKALWSKVALRQPDLSSFTPAVKLRHA